MYAEWISPSIREVDPGELRLPPSRASGADPWKLHQQIRQLGSSRKRDAPDPCTRNRDGILEISDGVDPYHPDRQAGTGQTVPIVVIGSIAEAGQARLA